MSHIEQFCTICSSACHVYKVFRGKVLCKMCVDGLVRQHYIDYRDSLPMFRHPGTESPKLDEFKHWQGNE